MKASAAARRSRVKMHLKVIALAAGFGLGAYAVIVGLVVASRRLGLLDWIAG